HASHESDFVIPLTLRDPLTSRVDRVKGRRVLQLAATLGRKFTYELLQAVSSLDAEALSKELRHLVGGEFVVPKGTVLQEATFEFKHALIRDAAYALLTKAEREPITSASGNCWRNGFPRPPRRIRRSLPTTTRKREATKRPCTTGTRQANCRRLA